MRQVFITECGMRRHSTMFELWRTGDKDFLGGKKKTDIAGLAERYGWMLPTLYPVWAASCWISSYSTIAFYR